MVIPFAPSAEWYASYLRAVASGLSADDAAVRACIAAGVVGKAFSRTLITGPQGPVRLTVPVDGGAGVLKRMGGGDGMLLPSPLLSSFCSSLLFLCPLIVAMISFYVPGF